jgi:ATP-dependent RNA helicase DeaD
MLKFNELGLSPNLLRGIEELGFERPTPIQEQIIPLFFEKQNDIIGLAQTGTGKTAAFGLPLIESMEENKKSVQALILAPTRELCIQITKDIQSFAKYTPYIKVVPVYGGASISTQLRELKSKPNIITATPGRMVDMINRGAVNLSNTRLVVLDEADEMLNMGFRDDLDIILSKTPGSKRTLLFSATISKEVSRISNNYLKDPVKIAVGEQNAGAENIRHLYYQVPARERYAALKRIVDINPDIYGIVFCRTRSETKDIADKLIKDGYNADALHGDLSQAQRDHVMKRFREKSLQMLVATDVAARGIDVNDISHVINYNLPDELETYTHRSGRTGRANKSGISIAIVHGKEISKISKIEKITRKRCEKMLLPTGAEICKKQLYKLVDKMEKAEVDEAQIAPFMETVNKKLEWLSKEDIIKHFLSLEFNRFLEYYKNAPDLNNAPKEKPVKAGKKNKERNDNFAVARRTSRERGGDKFSRFFISVGKKDGINPKNIIGLINDNMQVRGVNIGDIDIKGNFSFFEIDKKHSGKIMDAFNNVIFEGRPLKVEPAMGNNHAGKVIPKIKKKKKKYAW